MEGHGIESHGSHPHHPTAEVKCQRSNVSLPNDNKKEAEDGDLRREEAESPDIASHPLREGTDDQITPLSLARQKSASVQKSKPGTQRPLRGESHSHHSERTENAPR